MNKNRRLYIFLFSAIILFIFSYITYIIEEKRKEFIIDKKSYEAIYQEKEKELDDLTLKTKNALSENFDNENNLPVKSYFEVIESPEDIFYSILIYHDDSLKFWSDNSVPVLKKFNDTLFNKKTTRLDNGWYSVKRQDFNEYKIIGLLKIKNGYFYENEYLENDFTFGNIPSNFKITDSKLPEGVNITDSNNNYMFTIFSEKSMPNDESTELPSVLFFLASILLLFFVSILIRQLYKFKLSYVYSASIVIFISLSFLLIIIFQIPEYLFKSEFFSEIIVKFRFKSLGNVIILSFLFLFISDIIFKIFPFETCFEYFKRKSKYLLTAVFSIILVLSFLYFSFICDIIQTLVLKSDISYDIQKILKINIFSLSGHLITVVLFSSLIILIDQFIKLTTSLIKFQYLLVSLLISLVFIIFTDLFNFTHLSYLELVSFTIIVLIICIIRYYREKYTYYSFIILILAVTLFAVVFENKNIQEKGNNDLSTLINKLANEHDDMAEQFLKEIDQRIHNDTSLINMMIDINPNQDINLFDYLKRKYFYGYWEKYELELISCGNSEHYFEFNQANNCEGYYNREINSKGEKIGNTKFWFFDDNSGKVTYLGIVKTPLEKDNRNLHLYITLSEKLITKSLGYPKLLIGKGPDSKSEFQDYSYAKYTDGVLAVKYGNYQYDLIDKDFENVKNNDRILLNGYIHLIKTNESDNRIVFSREETQVYDLIISFAYLFVFYNLLFFIAILFADTRFILKKLNLDFKNQIRFSMILILLISFILFGAGTIYYAIEENKRTNNKEMTDKVQSVLIELKHKLQEEDKLTPEWHSDKYDHLDELLIKFSQVFFSDINLYNLDGNLLATSRSEIFNRGLIGKRMDNMAFKMMSIKKKTEFIQKENIGKLEFSSIYIPLKNYENKIIAYINLPYFSKNDKLQKNISNVLIATVNLYVVLFLLTIILAFFISTEITRPLRMLQNKFKALQLGKKHQEILYDKKDEIGKLVKEYNLMVSKLENSAKKLAESERESAWREMAKQIAHEIKNPLTPMKLSIQLLQKTWNDGSDNKEEFEKRLSRVSETLIEQINTLSSIASEFSSFAKMPKARNEEVDISKKLRTVAGLFENTKNISITLDLNNNEDLRIIADKEQVSRVFINLIKNSVQAMPKNKQGEITISLIANTKRATIIIADNGKGIPDDKKERLFEPSFTTKTTGMGIGLAIVKNIVNSAGGDIWFDSEVNKGTRFYVEFLVV